MSENTAIAWTDHTFNTHWGCHEVSPGCTNCYAREFARRFGTKWGVDEARREFGDKHWDEPKKWNARAERAGKRERVFCNSMSDWADKNSPPGMHDRLWALIRATPHLDWQLLTKRIGNVPKLLPADWGDGYPNVWLGASIVNQEEAERDITKLLAIAAAVHFVSLEPLLSAVDMVQMHNVHGLAEGQRYINALGGYAWDVHGPDYVDTCNLPAALGWVIVGGEGGPKARPFNIDWARQIVAQCKANKTPVFVKQMGSHCIWEAPDDGIAEPPYSGRIHHIDKKGGEPMEWPVDLRIQEFPT